MEDNMKFVDFERYCKTCIHKKKKEEEDPCWACLAEPARPESQKPVNYEGKDE